ncbi:MAG: tetratricopeptide repeat protein, partial [Gluconacetobacter diazotrophicus]|nr:tetratricopeptide repeat protein [Gluconacetobacter diazotrophicus]
MVPPRAQLLQSALDALRGGRFGEAEAIARPLCQAGDPEAALLLGLALGGSDRPVDAAALLCTVAAQRPDAVHPCVDLVSLLGRQHRAREAEPVFRACLALVPDDARLWLGLAQLLCETHRLDEANAALDESLRLKPDSSAALNQRAIILMGENRPLAAIEAFRRTVALDPGNAPAWANLGCTLAAEGEFEEALSAYRRSIALKADDPQVRLNHSICLLKAGRMTQGWLEHEWRFRLPGHTELPLDRLLPTLTPGMSLAGRSVLLTHEEGIGDTLMYLRYAPLLAERGAIVSAWVPAPLRSIAARVPGIASVSSAEKMPFEADWHCPFISLPRVFSATEDGWGGPVPYLDADPVRIAAAAGWLPEAPPGAAPPLRVGLVWGGAPRFENIAANGVDRRRSIGLDRLRPLANLRGVQLVSLQHGPHAAALAEAPEDLAIADPMGRVRDMDDTAAIIANLDVVASVDTSVVHLAGALGAPTILLDRYDNCWRWFHDRDDSP